MVEKCFVVPCYYGFHIGHARVAQLDVVFVEQRVEPIPDREVLLKECEKLFSQVLLDKVERGIWFAIWKDLTSSK